MTLATWKLAGIRGEREVMLAPFRLAGDGLAGINWLQLCCHFWPEWQFGRALRCKKQSSNLFPSPALLPTATLFLLTSGWCSLPLFVCASACTPFPAVVTFERHQRLLHLAPVSILLLMAVWIQDRFQQKKIMVTTFSFCFILWCVGGTGVTLLALCLEMCLQGCGSPLKIDKKPYQNVPWLGYMHPSTSSIFPAPDRVLNEKLCGCSRLSENASLPEP